VILGAVEKSGGGSKTFTRPGNLNDTRLNHPNPAAVTA